MRAQLLLNFYTFAKKMLYTYLIACTKQYGVFITLAFICNLSLSQDFFANCNTGFSLCFDRICHVVSCVASKFVLDLQTIKLLYELHTLGIWQAVGRVCLYLAKLQGIYALATGVIDYQRGFLSSVFFL